MKRILYLLFMASLMLPYVCNAQAKINDKRTVYIPISGNSWQEPTETNALHRSEGILQGAKDSRFNTFVRFSKTGNFQLQIALGLVSTSGVISVNVLDKTYEIAINAKNSEGLLDVGAVHLQDTGYVCIRLHSENGALPAVKGYQITGSGNLISSAKYVADNADNYFYWGRRGPSVHLAYTIPVQEDIEYYYNEVTVPKGSDIVGSYFMANGFAEGYFGMQVNSEQERRILFSVWSPFNTDNPKEIPEEQKIILVKKGVAVHAGEFGNEGSGGQSYMRYPWKAEQTYKFLLRGRPVADNYTEYTAWFFAEEEGAWKLVAQFLRPATHTYLKRFHSFLENFIPSQGQLERQVHFSNQWVCDVNGGWHPCERAKFTADATARKQYRMDYAGGFIEGSFYLRNCGFFSDYTAMDSSFNRPKAGLKPEISLTSLPLE